MDWYAFKAYNSQTWFGYGTLAEAKKWCALLNGGRSVNHYWAEPLGSREVASLGLDDNALGFNLADEIAEQIACNGDW